MKRREFLRQSLSATGALLLSAKFSRARGSPAAKKILVIGAGLSGMAAAYELEKLGHDVKILEAQARVGGRILTVRQFDDGLYAEAGAARIHRDHDLTLRYARAFDLPLVAFYPTGQKFAVIEDGQAKTVVWDDFREATEIVMHLDKPNRWQKIAGGNDRLPRAFEQRLSGKILFDAPVVRIAHNEREVAVTFRQKGKLETLRADRLVCTIPFTMLRQIEIEPAFSEAKMQVIRQMKYQAASRVLLQTKQRFWAARGLNGFGFGENYAEIWHSTFGQTGTRGVLQTYLRGDYALDLTKRAERERLELTLDSLEKLFPGARANYEKGLTKCWSEDPWTLGAWGHPETKQHEAVRRPESRVHFAGEHASDLASWMQGALQSALRVVEEIKMTAVD